MLIALERFGVSNDSTIKFIAAYMNVYGKQPYEMKMLIDSIIENDYGREGENLAFEKINVK